MVAMESSINPGGSGTVLSVIDHVRMENNTNDGLVATSGSQTINITVSDSVIASNGVSGISGNGTPGSPTNIMVGASRLLPQDLRRK